MQNRFFFFASLANALTDVHRNFLYNHYVGIELSQKVGLVICN